ncbi:hypothetical protein vBPaePPE3_055 [Pseudomonas phage vB_PaeP_PE3]|uniref:Uncharacterized protein gp49 n=2 Tax=Phikmvvirus TaxID=477967 RepID=A9J7E6_9CAUD|nr:hypothetical protein PPLUZ19_gp49 [Pseudomonas phage LUZ19]QHZ59717.1 hypothetical protein vBPaePPE3_055 [Pseudomonas phage vB_PaeP_PE3]CAP45523.1 hypothetical protein [Pseudomonas phage LUZ19]
MSKAKLRVIADTPELESVLKALLTATYAIEDLLNEAVASKVLNSRLGWSAVGEYVELFNRTQSRVAGLIPE